MSQPKKNRRQVDFQIISDWVDPRSRVLDLGCGRGILLETLKRQKQVFGVGVDVSLDKVNGCIRRGVPVYQGDVLDLLQTFPSGSFDHVICSRTVEQLQDPLRTLEESLRVGRQLTVGFVNYGYWLNRFSYLTRGQRIQNEVYPDRWYERRPANPFSLTEFEAFCSDRSIRIERRVLLRGDWKTPCTFMPQLFAGYALFNLVKG